jgi:DNA polymerase III sliding clamp (beta) subunit (PCNA family)
MTVQKYLSGETDDRGSGINFETDGNVFRPWIDLVRVLDSEARLTADTEGIHVELVDPANVGMIDTTLYRDAFDAYELEANDEYRTGVDMKGLASAASIARKGRTTADDLSVSFNGEERATLETEREYGSTTVERGETAALLNPDTIRQEPEIPGLNTTVVGEVESLPLRDVLDAVSEHAYLTADGDDLIVNEERDTSATAARFRDVLSESPDEPEAAVYSIDHLADMVSAIRGAKADTVRFEFSEEFPIKLHFERRDENDTVLYDGTFMLAPRVHSD